MSAEQAWKIAEDNAASVAACSWHLEHQDYGVLAAFRYGAAWARAERDETADALAAAAGQAVVILTEYGRTPAEREVGWEINAALDAYTEARREAREGE